MATKRRREPKTIPLPVHLARLLLAEPKDFKNPARYAEAQGIAKALLRTLLAAANVRDIG